MQISALYILTGILFFSGPLAAVETPVVPEPNVVPNLTVEQPTNPVSSNPGGPILVSIGARLGPSVPNMPTAMIIPEFHFVAPNGNAVLLHRDVVESSGNNINVNPSTTINIPPEAQKKGAVVSGGFTCNKDQFYTTMTAYIMDADGNRSNSVQYTVHCNGG